MDAVGGNGRSLFIHYTGSRGEIGSKDSFRHSDYAATIASTLHKYEVVQNAFLAIMNEFWQTNAFFTGFAALAIGGIVTNWQGYSSGYPIHIAALTALIVLLLVVWFLSLLKHIEYTYAYQRKLEDLENYLYEVESPESRSALTIYRDRHRAHERPLRYSVRYVWLSVPLIAIIAIVALLVIAVADG